MRWRLIVLGLIAVGCAIGFVALVNLSAGLSFQASQIYVDLENHAPTEAQQAHTTKLYQQSYGLQTTLMPLATASLICALAIPLVLARRWQLREQAGDQTAATRTISAAGST